MMLSDAIIQGSFDVVSPIKGLYIVIEQDGIHACPLGCIWLAVSYSARGCSSFVLQTMFPELGDTVIHPVTNLKQSLLYTIMNLNDDHNWSIYRIASWLHDRGY